MKYADAKRRHEAAKLLVEYYRVEMLHAKKPTGANRLRAKCRKFDAITAMRCCGVLPANKGNC